MKGRIRAWALKDFNLLIFFMGTCENNCVFKLSLLQDLKFIIRDVEAVIFRPLLLPHLSLPLPPTKNEKTTVDNFFTFVGL